jgi:hypothetical protein
VGYTYSTSNTTGAAVQSPFDTAFNSYIDEVHRIALEVLTREVWPLFKRRKYRMLSGNGTFYIENRNEKQLSTDPRDYPQDPDFKRVLEILNAEIPGIYNCIGDIGYDFPNK